MTTEAELAIFLKSETPELKERSGLRDRSVDGNVLTDVLDPGPAYRDADGTIPFGSLCFLVDTSVGIASRIGSGSVVGGVTSELAFSVIEPLGTGPIGVTAQAVAFTDATALAVGTFARPDGRAIGTTTLRSTPVPGRPTSLITPTVAQSSASAGRAISNPHRSISRPASGSS